MIKSAQWVVCTKVYMTSDVHAHDRRVNEVCVCARVPHLHITMCRCCSVPEFTQGANKWNTCCEGTAGW